MWNFDVVDWCGVVTLSIWPLFNILCTVLCKGSTRVRVQGRGIVGPYPDLQVSLDQLYQAFIRAPTTLSSVGTLGGGRLKYCLNTPYYYIECQIVIRRYCTQLVHMCIWIARNGSEIDCMWATGYRARSRFNFSGNENSRIIPDYTPTPRVNWSRSFSQKWEMLPAILVSLAEMEKSPRQHIFRVSVL